MDTFNPQVGDRANVRYLSDVQPCTVIRRTPTTVTIRVDHADLDPAWRPQQLIGGFAAHTANNHDQRWIISDNPNGHTRRFSLRANGRWVMTGSPLNGPALSAGWRCFYDYNF